MARALPYGYSRVAYSLLVEYIGVYGCPKRWLSDRGTQLKSQTFKELSRLVGVDHQFSTAYSSEESGTVERGTK